VAAGHGLLLERLSGERLPGALLVPAGLAAVVVVVELVITVPGVARLATPVVVALAIAGWIAGRRRRPDGAALAAALGAFAVYAAPIVLSGHATFAGYIKLDDGATFMALTDRAMEHGRSLSGLAPSTYQATLDAYMGTGYPLGSMLPLGALRPLVATDLAWLYQPWLAFLAAMIAAAGYVLLRGLVRPRAAAFGAFVASSSALLFGYALWGGVKELATAWLLATMAALVPPLLASSDRLRAVVPIAVVVAAMIDTVTVGGGVWIAPVLLLALGAGLAARRA